MFTRLDPNSKPYKLQGNLILNGILAEEATHEEAFAYPYIVANQRYWQLNDTVMAALAVKDEHLFKHWRETNLVYPALNPPGNNLNWIDIQKEEYPYGIIYDAVIAKHDKDACFDAYYIPNGCSAVKNDVWDIWAQKVDRKIYFNDPAVQKAIHAPQTDWFTCLPDRQDTLFLHYDSSYLPMSKFGHLPGTIQRSKRTIIANGGMDAMIPTDGVLLAIQQMTWNGKAGFDSKPITPFYIDGKGKQAGVWHEERNLHFVEIFDTGHFFGLHAPEASYKLLQFLLGKIPSL